MQIQQANKQVQVNLERADQGQIHENLSQDGECGIKVLQEVTWKELGKESMGYTSSVLVRAESSRIHHNFMVTLNYTDAQISP